MVAFSIQDATIKWLSGDYPLHEVVFARAMIGCVMMLALMHFEGGLRMLATSNLRLLVARGLLIAVANSCFFAALAAMQMAEAVAIFFVAPLVITAMSAMFLGEPVGPRRWGAVIVGLVGVVVVMRPGSEAFTPVAVLPVMAALAYSSMQMLTRRIGTAEKASTMAFFIQLTMVSVSLVMWAVAGHGRYAPDDNPSLEFLLRAWTVPNAFDAVLFVGIGALSAAGAYLISQGYRIAQAPLLAPFEYVALPMAVLLGLVLFDERPDGTAMAGIALILASGLYTLHRETVRRREVADTPD